MDKISRLLYLAQLTDTELLLDYKGVMTVVPWLIQNDYGIVSWAGLTKAPKGAITQPEYLKKDIALGCDMRHSLSGKTAKNSCEIALSTITEAHHAWSGYTDNKSRLSFCLTLNKKIMLSQKLFSPLVRGFAFIMGVCALVMAGGGAVSLLIGTNLDIRMALTLLFCGLLGAPIFLYAAITGRRSLRLLDDPLWLAKVLIRYKVRLEDGTRRWKVFQ